MATSETNDSEVIEETITSMGVLNNSDEYDDRIRTARFGDDGYAEASLYFEGCASSSQVQAIRESGIWEIKSIHPKGNDGVHVQLQETRRPGE